MVQEGIVFTGDIEEFRKFTNVEAFDGTLQKHVRKALIKASLLLLKEVKQRIRDRKYEKNSTLTIRLMGGKKDVPLAKKLNLFRAMAYKLNDMWTSEVGFLSAAKSTGGVTGDSRDIKKVVELMHSGYTINVTPKMLAAIFKSFDKQRTKKGKLTKNARETLAFFQNKGGGGRSIWRVPPRPFMTDVLNDPKTDLMIRQCWREALEATFKEQGAKGGEHKDR